MEKFSMEEVLSGKVFLAYGVNGAKGMLLGI
jgi:hypothetical protein